MAEPAPSTPRAARVQDRCSPKRRVPQRPSSLQLTQCAEGSAVVPDKWSSPAGMSLATPTGVTHDRRQPIISVQQLRQELRKADEERFVLHAALRRLPRAWPLALTIPLAAGAMLTVSSLWGATPFVPEPVNAASVFERTPIAVDDVPLAGSPASVPVAFAAPPASPRRAGRSVGRAQGQVRRPVQPNPSKPRHPLSRPGSRPLPSASR
jgi:hypothetical protein